MLSSPMDLQPLVTLSLDDPEAIVGEELVVRDGSGEARS